MGAIHSTRISGLNGVEWIATGPNGLVLFHSQNEFRAHLSEGCSITVARIKARLVNQNGNNTAEGENNIC